MSQLPDTTPLLAELRQMIQAGRQQVAVTVNRELVGLYWQVGHRIRTEILGGERAKYGKQIVQTLAKHLAREFGAGFSRANLFHMIRFVEAFPDIQIVYALSRQLTWTHFRDLIYLDDPLKRSFYAELCRVERWNTRTLKEKIDGMLYERTALSRRPEALIEQELTQLRESDQLTPDLLFRDPYLLDFLNLPTLFSEQDLEQAILRELESFLVELGTDFCFVARQKRMAIGPDDFYLDLLFFHRGLRCLVAIELKLGRFTARDKGQLELYLRWLDRNERRSGENAPLGLILCSEKNQEQVELLELDAGSIRVAEYLTELPPRDLLEQKLHDALVRARHLQGAQAPSAPLAIGANEE